MGRSRIYASAAERQRAYRRRLAAGQAAPAPPPESRPRRQPSRPARLAAVRSAVVQLFDEYENWLAAVPESLQESGQAQRLAETIDQLAAVVDLLCDIDPPRGFGRD
ncbi:MAG: hypothetical protein ACOX9B_15375 [Candidatus Xenobium sp.]|jgi:hypothetical protein|nr:hypothetical protein [Burkholderiales bacterium]